VRPAVWSEPRRRQYRYRYLDAWCEKEDKAAMIFGRCFESALSAYFAGEDSTARFYQEWRKYQDASLAYPKNDSWDRPYHQGIHLLERFTQDDRVRVARPKENLQVKVARSLQSGSQFLSYIDAIGEFDGTKCIIDWKTTGTLTYLTVRDLSITIMLMMKESFPRANNSFLHLLLGHKLVI